VKSDFQLVKEMGLKETGILTSASDYHIFLKLGKTRKQAMEDYLDIVRASVENGIRCRCHLEDLTRADFYGFIVPFAQQAMRISEESGVVVKMRLCDTMGYGISYPQSALPRSIPKLVHGLIHDAGVPKNRLEWHGHNDFHKVLINAATAWLYGCAAANATLLGFGERTGNPPLEGLIFEYIGLVGHPNGIETTVIHEIADYLMTQVGVRIPSNYPFVGQNFNVTMAGIHADGLIKNEEIYNIFDTRKILNRPVGVGVTDKSGVAGIAFWLNSFLGLEGTKMIDKRNPGLSKIAEWVDKQYALKRVTAISPEELLQQAEIYLPEYVGDDVMDRLRKARMF
jgi:isopropylmalate/homocitrate/citramalate synthase